MFAVVKVISYNLRKNRASTELVTLVEQFDPNILCLQEADTSALPAELGKLHLADSTSRNRLGLALYYSRERFEALARVVQGQAEPVATGRVREGGSEEHTSELQ